MSRHAGAFGLAAVALAGGGLASRAGAQTPAAVIAGTVTDRQSDSGVAGAVVLLRGTLLHARTSDGGRFHLGGVPPGTYTVTVLALGYAPDSLTGVTVSAGDAREVTLALTRAAVGLADIVVTASRVPERAAESGASVSVLSAEGLARRIVTTLDQALLYEPGVTMNAGQIDIRGSAGIARGVGSRVLLLLDGHPILSGDGGETDFESLPLLDVDRVEVVRGAYSALYGSNALGGVVNILTAPIDSAPATAVRLHFGAWQHPDRYRLADARLDEKGFGVQHSRRLGGIGARVFLGREISDGYREDDAHEAWLARAKLESPSGSSHPWDAYAVWARQDDGEFFTWRSDSQPYQVDPATRADHEIGHKLLTGGSFTPIAGAGLMLRLSPYVNYNSVQNDFPSDSNADHHHATRAGATVDLALRSGGRHAVDVGTDLAHTVVVSNFLGAHRVEDAALFAQDAVGLSDRWTASLGARLDYHRASGGRPEWSASPKVGLSIRAGPRLSARLSAAHGFRSPSAIEQFVNTTQFGFRVVPNPALRSERVWSAETGLSASPVRRFRMDAALFQSEYRDLIAPCAVNFSTYTFCNLNRARVRGLDVSVKTGWGEGLLILEGTYLLLDSRDLDTRLPLPYRSRHNVTGTLSALRGLLGVDLRFRSRVQQVLQYPLDPRSAITVFDLRMAYRVAGVALQAKVSNLFQTFYVDVQERNPGAPRQLSLTAYRGF